MKIKKGDPVVVISGAHKSATPRRVTAVVDEGRKVVVEGVAQVFKHVRRGHPKSPQGGRLRTEMAIDVSNVMYFDESTGKPTRLGYRYLEDGTKERFCRGSGASAGIISPPRARYATKSD